MGHRNSQRREHDDDAEAEFASTVAMALPGAGARAGGVSPDLLAPGSIAPDSLVLDSLPPDSLPPDSLPPDSQPFESLPSDSVPADSLPADSLPPDSLPPDSMPPDLVLPDAPPTAGPSGLNAAEAADGIAPGVAAAQLLDELAADGRPAPADVATAARPTIGQIGRYALKMQLGAGGLGQVHEAWDPLLSRAVAIKTLHFHGRGPSRAALDRQFLNEARAIASLSHPHIVTVFDAGLSPLGVYLAMERLHGQDLRHRLAQGWQPSPSQAAHLVRRLADALAYAHAHGVVHCDIKPANIFITERDKPKILDFGIARIAHGRALAALDGWVAGSPHYLAPEQLRNEPVDARTDIYALGVVFYELLAGRKAFSGDSVEQITTAVLTNHPAAAHELRRGVSHTLSCIAARAMAADPEQRYASASAMARELRRWLERHSRTRRDRPEPRERADPARAMAVDPATPGDPTASDGRAATARLWRRTGSGAPVATSAAGRSPAAPTGARALAVATAGALMLVAAAVGLSTIDGSPAGADAPAVAGPEVTAPIAGDASGDAAPAPDAAASASMAPADGNAAPAMESGASVLPAAPVAATSAAAAGSGTLQFAISPWGEVEVNGQRVGTTPPLARLALPAGTHHIVVRNADFQPYAATVQLQADQPVTVRHRFGP